MVDRIWEQVKIYKVWLALGSLLVMVAVCLLTRQAMAPVQPLDFPTVESQVLSEHTEQELVIEENQFIVVDIKGAVVHEGLYELPKGSRVNDALTAAGGLRETADKNSVNLAQKLTDESVVYVAYQGENISVVTGSIPPTDGGQAKVNLNTADEQQLQTITGIGAKRARDIIAYRDSNGGFKSVDDLKNVSGIGEKTLEKIREDVTVD